MNKKAQRKVNFLVVILIAIVGILLFFMYFQGAVAKQEPGPIVFDEDSSSPGGIRVKITFEDGTESYIGEEFYKVDSGLFSIVRGATTISCDTDAICQVNCPVGDINCQDKITCYGGYCSYKEATGLTFETEVASTAEAELEVFFDSAVDDVGGSAFTTAHSALIDTSVILQSGESHIFESALMPISSYETSVPTLFTSGAHAFDRYYENRIPATGSQVSTVGFTIYPDPTSGAFTIQIGSLTGL